MKPNDVIGIASALFILAWVIYLIVDARSTARCRAGFSNARRFCTCGGEREFDGQENGTCTDHCTACGKIAETPAYVFTHGHPCNDLTIEPDGLCNRCGRRHEQHHGLGARAV